MLTAGVINHTLLKQNETQREVLNQHTIIELEWQNGESELKSNNGFCWQTERIKMRFNCDFFSQQASIVAE